VLRIGAAAVLLGCDPPSEDVGRRLAASEARLLFSGKAPPRADAEIAVGRDFLDQVAQWPLRADIAYRNDKDLAVLRYDEDDAHLVFARSVTHGALRAQAFTTATAALDLEPGDVVIGCPPAAAVGGVCCLNATVLAGACLLIPDLDAVADGEGAAAHVGPCTGTGHVKGW
jgi:long-chain acyl-CoA synthetase